RDGQGQECQGGRLSDGGWPYAAGAPSSTEPTALAFLSLSVTASPPDLTSAAQWLLSHQRDDGFWPACETQLEPSWTTPLAALACAQTGKADPADRAARALLDEGVYTFSPTALTGGIYGYDTAIPGWPWTAGDFSFV